MVCPFFQGEGYEKQLKEILNAEILPIVEDFDQKLNKGSRAPALTHRNELSECLNC